LTWRKKEEDYFLRMLPPDGREEPPPDEPLLDEDEGEELRGVEPRFGLTDEPRLGLVPDERDEEEDLVPRFS